MSSLKIEERFEFDAPPADAWIFLTQPARIVVCLPGAELTESIDDRNFAGGGEGEARSGHHVLQGHRGVHRVNGFPAPFSRRDGAGANKSIEGRQQAP